MIRIYTTGYSGYRLEDLVHIANEMNAVVCDIRHFPISKMPEWKGENLQRVLGHRYNHVAAWGNVNVKGSGPIELADAPLGLARVTRLSRKFDAVILLCGCREYSHCHRSVCAELFRGHKDWQRNERFEVEELTWPVANPSQVALF